MLSNATTNGRQPMSHDMHLTEREARAKRLEANARKVLARGGGDVVPPSPKRQARPEPEPEPDGLTEAARLALANDEPTPAMRQWCDDLDANESAALAADAKRAERPDPVPLRTPYEPLVDIPTRNHARTWYQTGTIAGSRDRYLDVERGGDGARNPMDSKIRRMVTKHDYVEEVILETGNSANRVRYVKKPGEQIKVRNDATGKLEPVARTRGYSELRKNGQSARNTKRGQYWSDPTAREASRNMRTGDETIMTVIMNRAQLTAFLTLVKITVGKSSFRDHGRIRDLTTLTEVTPDGEHAAIAMFTARDYRKIRKETRKTHANHNEYREVFQIMPK